MRMNHERLTRHPENPSPRTLRGLTCAVIVAHPDDETLWAGGTILMHPDNDWTILSACRKDDPDRGPKFVSVLDALNARGAMGTLDDGPDQTPLPPEQVEETLLSLLPGRSYDLIFTHSPQGEYTRHRRHEEVAAAVIGLIETQRLHTPKLRMFAYEDGGRQYLPRPITDADAIVPLPRDIWDRKYEIITTIYGFHADSWEAKTTPHREAFWSFHSVSGIQTWIQNRSQVQ